MYPKSPYSSWTTDFPSCPEFFFKSWKFLLDSCLQHYVFNHSSATCFHPLTRQRSASLTLISSCSANQPHVSCNTSKYILRLHLRPRHPSHGPRILLLVHYGADGTTVGVTPGIFQQLVPSALLSLYLFVEARMRVVHPHGGTGCGRHLRACRSTRGNGCDD